MLGLNNFIFTDSGIASIQSLKALNDAKSNLPRALSFDTNPDSPTFLSYQFIQIDHIDTVADCDMYEVKFSDVFLNRTITLNCSGDSEIFKYNVIQTDNNSLLNKNYEVVKYLKSNLSRNSLSPGWTRINQLVNYATKSPNIVLGDNVVKYQHRFFKGIEIGYQFIDNKNSVIPVFSCLTTSAFYNFILIK